MMTRLILTLLAATVLAFAACEDDDNGDSAPAATEAAAETATTEAPAGPTEVAGPTGVPEVDSLIEAVLAGDTAAIAQRVRFTTLACADVMGPGGPPPCREGEPEGTQVEVLPVGTCEGELRRPDVLDGTIETLIEADAFFAAYQGAPNQGPAGDYAVVFSRLSDGTELGLEVTLDAGEIVYLKFACGETPGELVELLGLSDPI